MHGLVGTLVFLWDYLRILMVFYGKESGGSDGLLVLYNFFSNAFGYDSFLYSSLK